MIIFSIFACTIFAPLNHPFHVSVAEMEFNKETGCLEVALKVWPEDLEKALNQGSKTRIDLDKTKNIDQLITNYLKKNIRIESPDKKKAELNWIGKELEIKQAWLYFEVKTVKEPVDFTYSNRIFFVLQDDQINMFNLKFKTRRASISFARDKDAHQLQAKDFVPIRNPFSRPSKK